MKRFVFSVVTVLLFVFSKPVLANERPKHLPQDLLLKPGSKVNLEPPKQKLTSRQVKEDIDLLRYAIGHAWAPAWLVPNHLRLALVDIGKIASEEVSPEKLCDLIGDAMFLVPDNHSYAQIGDRKCGSKEHSIDVVHIGENLAKTSKTPYLTEWKEISKQRILVFAARSFPGFGEPVYRKLKDEFPKMLAESKGLIIDLRGHSGGDNDPGYFIASLLWGKKAPKTRDPFQVQTSEALALFANRFDFDLKTNRTGRGSLEWARSQKNQLIAEFRQSIDGKVDLLRYIEKNEYLDDQPKDMEPDRERGYRHAIVVIMDQDAGSGSEDMIGSLEKHPKVILVGQNSSGSTHFGNSGFLLLPHSKIQVWLSTSFSRFRDGRFIERIGFKPKIFVPGGTDAMRFIDEKWFEIIGSSARQKSEISWKETVDAVTAKDACGTWNDFFRSKYRPAQSKNYCSEVYAKSINDKNQYEYLSLEEIKGLNLENAGMHRWIGNPKTAEEAYPENDRPRGQKDIDSVNYHVSTRSPISPVIIARLKFINNEVRYVELDGVHRIVAASIRNSKVKVLFLDL